MLLLILGLAAAVTAIVLILLNWERIVSWFQNREELLESDKDNIAVGIKQALAEGRVTYVQGIFNKRTEKLVDVEKYNAEKLDKKTAEYHKKEDMIIIS